MNVDKFGHHLHKSKRFKPETPVFVYCNLNYTSDKNLDAQNKVIKNIQTPINENDAVNKEYVDKSLESLNSNLQLMKFDKFEQVIEICNKKIKACENNTQQLTLKLKDLENKVNTLLNSGKIKSKK